MTARAFLTDLLPFSKSSDDDFGVEREGDGEFVGGSGDEVTLEGGDAVGIRGAAEDDLVAVRRGGGAGAEEADGAGDGV